MNEMTERTLAGLLVAPAIGAVALNLAVAATSVVNFAISSAAVPPGQIVADAFSDGGFFWLIVGLCVSYVAALPVALIAHAAFLRLRWRKAWQYAVAGAVVGLAISAAILHLLGGWQSLAFNMPTLGPPSAIAGASGAAAFWWMAVRRVNDRPVQRSSDFSDSS
jgi:hypothetical protein